MNEGRLQRCLDRTILYPVGGGQPSDTGKIVGVEGAEFMVEEVKAIDGVVYHYGTFAEGAEAAGAFEEGAVVTVHVDIEKRLMHARIHSAGHLLDVAMTNIGYGPEVMVPTKGLHTPEQAYVEYQGKSEGDKDAFAKTLEAEINRLIAAGGNSTAAILGYDEAAKACGGSLPPYIPADSTPRIVTIVADTAGCPCGGTHVADVKEIESVAVTGVRVKKGVTRVSYTIAGMSS